MSTNIQVIGDALKLLGVISKTQTPSAEQGSHALRVLNQMLELWTEEGVQLGYFAQSATTDICPIPAWAEQGVTSKLAQRLRATYPASSLAPEVLDDAQNGYGTILRKSIVESMEPADMSHMPQGSGYGFFRDITQ